MLRLGLDFLRGSDLRFVRQRGAAMPYRLSLMRVLRSGCYASVSVPVLIARQCEMTQIALDRWPGTAAAQRVTGSYDIAGLGPPHADFGAIGCTTGIPFVEVPPAGTSRYRSRCETPIRIGNWQWAAAANGFRMQTRNGLTRRMLLDRASFPWLRNVCEQVLTGSSSSLAAEFLANENSRLLLVQVGSCSLRTRRQVISV